MIAMPDNDFWIGQEQIPVDLSLLLTYHNDEDTGTHRGSMRSGSIPSIP